MRKSPKSSTNSIQVLSTAVFDNGRRGLPKIGCDCEACFGYCLVDPEVVLRQRSLAPAAETA
jgi:hypothetical protein